MEFCSVNFFQKKIKLKKFKKNFSVETINFCKFLHKITSSVSSVFSIQFSSSSSCSFVIDRQRHGRRARSRRAKEPKEHTRRRDADMRRGAKSTSTGVGRALFRSAERPVLEALCVCAWELKHLHITDDSADSSVPNFRKMHGQPVGMENQRTRREMSSVEQRCGSKIISRANWTKKADSQ